MAAKALGRWTEKDKRFSGVIEGYMKMARVDYKSISKRLGRCTKTHYNHLEDPGKMTLDDLRVYIDVLKIPEEKVLDALYINRRG